MLDTSVDTRILDFLVLPALQSLTLPLRARCSQDLVSFLERSAPPRRAKMLTKEVYLHLALTSNLRSGRLPNLFQQTLKWQRHNEEPLWLPKYLTALIFRVSAPQSYPDSVQVISETKLACPASRAQNDLASDIYTKAPLDDIPAESPSLVSQLQQVHGLTKKKVYGTKPALIMERVRDPYRKAPNQSPSISLAPETGAPPSLTRGSRSRSNLKPDSSFSSRLQRIVEPYPQAAVQQWQQQPMPPQREIRRATLRTRHQPAHRLRHRSHRCLRPKATLTCSALRGMYIRRYPQISTSPGQRERMMWASRTIRSWATAAATALLTSRPLSRLSTRMRRRSKGSIPYARSHRRPPHSAPSPSSTLPAIQSHTDSQLPQTLEEASTSTTSRLDSRLPPLQQRRHTSTRPHPVSLSPQHR
ncbi:hypothetical protein B0H14DRAFT_500546 [Mycena olivaceomarginata]|nr:hypothetical protein B0H14DRAFT_500546 [Mycena olivaceomarginata]